MINIKLEYIINSIGLLGALLISYKTYNYTKCNMYDPVPLKNKKNLTVEIDDILPNDPPNITEFPDDSNDESNHNPIIMMASI